MKTNDGGPAFPIQDLCGPEGQAIALPGMSLRDWFAGQALAAYLSSESAQMQLHEEVNAAKETQKSRRDLLHWILARRAYLVADAMLAERETERS